MTYIALDDLYSIADKLEAWAHKNPHKRLLKVEHFRLIVSKFKPVDKESLLGHACWVEDLDNNKLTCSRCNKVISDERFFSKPKYCEDCGALMDLTLKDLMEQVLFSED